MRKPYRHPPDSSRRFPAGHTVVQDSSPVPSEARHKASRPRRAKVLPLPRGNPQALVSLDSLCTPPRLRPSRCRCCSRSTRVPTGAGPRTASATARTPATFVCRLPLQPLHQPADRHLRWDRYQKVHVIFAHVPLQDVDVQSSANLADQVPHPMTHCPASTGLRYFVTQTRCKWISKTLCAPCRYSSMGLFYRNATLKPSPKGEGFDPPSMRQ